MIKTDKNISVAEPSRSYDSYKDSGVEWLGEIPEHWEVTRLANIGRFSSSGIDKLIKKNESLVKIINYTDVYRNLRFTIDSKINFMEVTTSESNRLKNLVKKGDLIFLPSSETFEDLGLSALVDEDIENLSFSYHVLRFEFTEALAHNFKKYFTNNNTVLKEFSKKGTGSIRKTLNRIDFRNTVVVLPPLSEQTTIANFLDDKTEKIDRAISIKEQQIALLKERKQTLIHKAVTRGLDDSVPLKDSGVEWIGEIPEHWEVSKLGFLTTKIGDGLHGTPEYTDGTDYYFINGNNLSTGYIKITSQTKTVSEKEYLLHKKELTKNTLLLSINGTIGNVAFYCGESVMLGKSAAYLNFFDNVNINYIKCFLESSSFKNYYELELSGSTIKNLSLYSIGKTPITFPPKNEQSEIVEFVMTGTQKIDTAIHLKQQEIAKLQEYKRSLINSVVTGRVKVL